MSLTFRGYDKLEIARSFVELAIEIYTKGKNYFAAMHLAGAAEEIIGKQIQANGKQTALESERDGLKKIFKINITDKDASYIFNKGKNSIKHMSAFDSSDRYLTMDPRTGAQMLIDRAIINWWRLDKKLSNNMKVYWESHPHTVWDTGALPPGRR